MISSRRLAREWALRILYQCDVLIPVTRDITQPLTSLLETNAADAPTPQAAWEALYTARNVLARGIFMMDIPSADQARLRQILDEATVQWDTFPKPVSINNLLKFLRGLNKEINSAEKISLASEVKAVYESTFDRLRTEFVQRGSRTASGSAAEEILLEFLTTHLETHLSNINAAQIRSIVVGVHSLLLTAPHWQEEMLIEAFRGVAPTEIRRTKPGRELKKILADIPVLLTRILDTTLSDEAATLADSGLSTLNADDTYLLSLNTGAFRAEVRSLLEIPLWEKAFDFVRECAVACDGVPATAARTLVLDKQTKFVVAQIAYWEKISSMVEKQLADWLQTATFTRNLTRGTQEKQAEIDIALAELTAGWSMERQPIVDRNILRLAGYEMLFLPDIPAGVSINEAVELAKKYSTGESGKFVNGVLGTLATKIGAKNPAKLQSAAEPEIPNIEEIPESEENAPDE